LNAEPWEPQGSGGHEQRASRLMAEDWNSGAAASPPVSHSFVAFDEDGDAWSVNTDGVLVENAVVDVGSDVTGGQGIPANVVARIILYCLGTLVIFAIVMCYLAEMFSSTGFVNNGGRAASIRMARREANVEAMEFVERMSFGR
jgi:hypothetical protein